MKLLYPNLKAVKLVFTHQNRIVYMFKHFMLLFKEDFELFFSVPCKILKTNIIC